MSKVEIPFSTLSTLWKASMDSKNDHKWCLDNLSRSVVKDLLAQKVLDDEEIEYAKSVCPVAFKPNELTQDQILCAINSPVMQKWEWVKYVEDISRVQWNAYSFYFDMNSDMIRKTIKCPNLSDDKKVDLIYIMTQDNMKYTDLANIAESKYLKDWVQDPKKIISCIRLITAHAFKSEADLDLQYAIDSAYRIVCDESAQHIVSSVGRISNHICRYCKNLKWMSERNKLILDLAKYKILYQVFNNSTSPSEPTAKMIRDNVREGKISIQDLRDLHMDGLINTSEAILNTL